MPFADFISVFQWWGLIFLLGITFLPLTLLLFSSFFDKGYIFSKILGLLLLSFTIWFLASLRLIPFNTLPLVIIWLIFAGINAFVLFRNHLAGALRSHLKLFAAEEGVFALGLLFWAFVRAHEPSIHGLEKFMDFGIINSILRTTYFPPQDIWMTPLTVNYYYFGHLVGAVLTKLSGFDPAIAYNLILATIFGLTLSASFSLGANLYHFFTSQSLLEPETYNLKSIFAGCLSAFLVTLGGNLHTIYVFFQSYVPDNPVPFWTLQSAFNFSAYWYPNATRFIPFTIHEFPLYSFVVADLHGHVFNIPFVLLLIALLISIFHAPKLNPIPYTLVALLVATSLMTNVLDGPIYLLVIGLVLLSRQISLPSTVYPDSRGSSTNEIRRDRLRLFAEVSSRTAVVALGAIILSLPFWLSFKPFGSGIGVLCAPQFLTNIGKLGPLLFESEHCARSPLWMLFILWGFFFFVIFGFIIKLLKSPRLLKSLNPTDLFALTLALASTILILIPEFFYVKDIYPTHYRANTVFKLGYQAFIILALSSGYMLTRILTSLKKTVPCTSSSLSDGLRAEGLYPVPLLLLFILVALYPNFAINSYYGGLNTYKGLSGLSYLNELYPTDYKAILWLRDNIKNQPVILEGQGDSYTDFARVSSNTGLPTVIGWPVHEWLWRGSYDEAGKRGTDVTTLYESTDLNIAKELIQKYKIEYIFIGTLERQKYQKLDESKFNSLGKVIFQSGQTKIYQVL